MSDQDGFYFLVAVFRFVDRLRAGACFVLEAPRVVLDPCGAAVRGVRSGLIRCMRRCRGPGPGRAATAARSVRTVTGSATRSRRPGSTLMPVMSFQRRNSLSETPKRSAMVTSVSPRRTV